MAAVRTVMRGLRELRGMTQGALARRLRVSQPAVSKWEAGGDEMPSARRAEVAAILGCDPARLLDAWDDWLLDGGGASL